MTARSIRSLENLENTASTARVLNLRSVALRYCDDPNYRARPFFCNPSLNKSIIVKHRLRQNEREDFAGHRQVVTKILLPIEMADLRMGARYLFIGQKNFTQVMSHSFGIDMASGDQDARALAVLDATPSLDPFLLREQLRVQKIDPAPCYFEISEADMSRMFAFAQSEVQQLVEMSLGGGSDLSVTASHPHASRLARRILHNANDPALEPLRMTMQLTPQKFQEGIFCWKAFLYYKWRLRDVMKGLAEVLGEIKNIKPRGPMDSDTRAYLAIANKNIRTAVSNSCRKVTETLSVYDDAYHALTRHNDPLRFRDFLLQAPALFNDLGERLGGIDHVISFWRFRFPEDRRSTLVTPEELSDIYSDFEQSLSGAAPR